MARKKRIPKAATLDITALSHEGRGIATDDGKITFVFGALEGETVEVLYSNSRAKFNEADTTKVIKAAANRVQPPCEYFGVCGGCSLQHLKHSEQIKHKQDTLAELLQHQAHTSPTTWLPAIVDQPLGYRRKARLSVRHVRGKEKVLVGFRERYSRFVANIDHCAVLHPSVGTHIKDISAMLYTLEQRDHIAQIEVAITDDISALIIRHLKPLPLTDLDKIKQLAQALNFQIYLQPKGIDTIHLLYPEKDNDKLSYSLQPYQLKLEFHPSQFTQINQAINEKMIIQAINLLELTPNDKVLDLFCGIGNFTLPAAQYCQSVTGVEGSQDAIEQAQCNANLNDISNVSFHCNNLFESSEHMPWANQPYNKLIIDPPRSGAQEILSQLDRWKPSRIVYVSCNPATLARDTKQIISAGYQLAQAGVMDMFPHTQHIEAMALFIRSQP